MKQLAVIILNWNGGEMLKRCLHSLETEFSPADIWVIDNNSSDDSAHLAQLSFPGINLIPLEKNYGFAEGYNRGIVGILPQYEFVLLLNNDTIIQPSFGDGLRSSLSSLDSTDGMVSVKMIQYPQMVIDNYGLILHPSGLGFNAKSGSDQVMCPSGGAAVYRTLMLEQCRSVAGEIFDADFQFYNEDLDLGLRGRILGWKCATYTDVAVFHAHGKSMLKRGNTFGLYFQQRNQLWAIVKNYPLRWWLLFGWQVIALQVLQIFYHMILGHGWTVIRAKWASLLGLPLMFGKRTWLRKSTVHWQRNFLTPASSLLRLWRG